MYIRGRDREVVSIDTDRLGVGAPYLFRGVMLPSLGVPPPATPINKEHPWKPYSHVSVSLAGQWAAGWIPLVFYWRSIGREAADAMHSFYYAEPQV